MNEMRTYERIIPKRLLGQIVSIIHQNKITQVMVSKVETSQSLSYDGTQVTCCVDYHVQLTTKPKHKGENPYRWRIKEEEAHATPEDLIASLKK